MSDARDLELQKMKDKLKANQDAIAALQQESTGIQAQIRIFGTHQAELKNATEKQLIVSQSDIETLGAAAALRKPLPIERRTTRRKRARHMMQPAHPNGADLLKALGEVKAPAPAKPRTAGASG